MFNIYKSIKHIHKLIIMNSSESINFIEGDCLKLVDTILPNSIDVIYLDPPFDSNRNYVLSADNNVGFNDKWNHDDYEVFIQAVVQKCIIKLKEKGSLFFHISTDRMFIPEKILRQHFPYVQPIFWKKCRSKNNVTSKLGSTIDIIFKCNKHKSAKFNLVYQAKDEKYLNTSFKNSDERGNYALGHIITEPSKKGYMYEYTFQNVVYSPKTGWRIKMEDLAALDADNRLHIPKSKGAKLYKKIYLHENPGKACTDLWDDIHSLAQGSEVRSYPTAKPVELLERIIQISSDPGDIILDPMCGSGTTGLACKNLNRKCILMDQNSEVKSIVNQRIGLTIINNEPNEPNEPNKINVVEEVFETIVVKEPVSKKKIVKRLKQIKSSSK